MANPSLQIGNSNWAIKEDNLLGYSTAGTRFVPQPITMTRASAGTRVNSSGLVETVELLGSELVDLSSFIDATNWAINGSEIEASGTTALFKQPFTLGAGKTFKITIVVDSLSSGNFEFWVGGYSNDTPTISSADTYTYYVTSGGSELYMGFNPHSNLIATISSISVKESTKNNLARVDYDGTASSLLVEPERTNLVIESEDFEDASYGEYLVSYTPNFATSPSGVSNATKLTSSGVYGNVNLNFTKAASETTYTQSIFIKPNNYTLVNFISYGASSGNRSQVTFDLSNGTISTAASSTGAFSNASATITSYTNDYYKISLTYTTDSSAQIRPTISFPLEMDSTNYVIIWGMQLEVGSYPTSYIPTDGGTVTRVKDQYSKTGISNLINSEEGVLFVEFENIVDSAAPVAMLSLSDGSATNRIGLFVSGGQISVESAGSGTNLGIYSKALQSGFNKIAVKYKVNDCALWVNGTKYTDTSFAAFTSNTLNSLVFDRGDAGQPFFGKVKQLQVFKTALTDDELTILTGTSGVHFFPSYASMASALTYTIE